MGIGQTVYLVAMTYVEMRIIDFCLVSDFLAVDFTLFDVEQTATVMMPGEIYDRIGGSIYKLFTVHGFLSLLMAATIPMTSM